MSTMLATGKLTRNHNSSLLTRQAQRYFDAVADELRKAEWGSVTEFDGVPVVTYPDFATLEFVPGVTVHVERVAEPAFPETR